MERNDREFSYEIKKHIGVLDEFPSGWRRELNIVRWNGGQAKYDIRDWDKEHMHMSRGVTLTKEQMDRLVCFIT